MEALIGTTALVVATFMAVVVGLAITHRRLPANADPVVAAVEASLPGTQCAQCGYPGCRPYAIAVIAGEALDLCAPGGTATQDALARLLGRSPGARLREPEPVVARIDESRCVGCFLCIEACPVDAIVGAPRFLHTVIEDRCTGCGLCLPPCPMDCIALESVAAPLPPPPTPEVEPCIRCGRCEPVCPEGLAPQTLWWFARGGKRGGERGGVRGGERGRDLARAEALGLDLCIECGKCNTVCPSGIDLAGVFRQAKAALAAREHATAVAERARAHHRQHETRIAADRLLASDRRRLRIADAIAGRSTAPTQSDD